MWSFDCCFLIIFLYLQQSNTIRNNLLSGVNVAVGVCCTIQSNGIYDNRRHGVVTAGLGTVQHNDLLAHVHSTLRVLACANVTVTGNRLHAWRHCRHCGRGCVRVEAKSRIVLDGNQFFVTLPPPFHALPASPEHITNDIEKTSSKNTITKRTSLLTTSSLGETNALKPNNGNSQSQHPQHQTPTQYEKRLTEGDEQDEETDEVYELDLLLRRDQARVNSKRKVKSVGIGLGAETGINQFYQWVYFSLSSMLIYFCERRPEGVI